MAHPRSPLTTPPAAEVAGLAAVDDAVVVFAVDVVEPAASPEAFVAVAEVDAAVVAQAVVELERETWKHEAPTIQEEERDVFSKNRHESSQDPRV